jgi:hypothetical protein
MWTDDLRNIYEMEVRKHYQIKISNRFVSFLELKHWLRHKWGFRIYEREYKNLSSRESRSVQIVAA